MNSFRRRPVWQCRRVQAVLVCPGLRGREAHEPWDGRCRQLAQTVGADRLLGVVWLDGNRGGVCSKVRDFILISRFALITWAGRSGGIRRFDCASIGRSFIGRCLYFARMSG